MSCNRRCRSCTPENIGDSGVYRICFKSLRVSWSKYEHEHRKEDKISLQCNHLLIIQFNLILVTTVLLNSAANSFLKLSKARPNS